MFKARKSLDALTQRAELPKAVAHSHIPMGTKIHLPTDSAYNSYIENYETKLTQLLQKESMHDPYFILKHVLLFQDDKDKSVFTTNGKITDYGLTLAALSQHSFTQTRLPKYTRNAFKQTQYELILRGIDRPVLKVFFYLLIKGKQVYSSNGFDHSGESTYFDGKCYPYGVSFREGGNTYRVTLIKEGFQFFIRDKETCNWHLLTNHFAQSILNLRASEIIATEASDFDYLDIESEAALNHAKQVLATYEQRLLPELGPAVPLTNPGAMPT